MSDIPSIVITPSTEVSSEPIPPPLPARTVSIKTEPVVKTIPPPLPPRTVSVSSETVVAPSEVSSQTSQPTVTVSQPTVTVSKGEPIDDGGWLWMIILAVLTLVTLGLIFQIVIKLMSKPDKNIATSSIVIIVSISLIAIGWLARSKGYKVVAIITPLLATLMLSIFNFMV
jgi:hypothetical protein